MVNPMTPGASCFGRVGQAANPEPATACLTLIVGVATCAIAFALKGLKDTALFNKVIRERIAEFAPTMSIILATSSSLWLSSHLRTTLTTLSLPVVSPAEP